MPIRLEVLSSKKPSSVGCSLLFLYMQSKLMGIIWKQRSLLSSYQLKTAALSTSGYKINLKFYILAVFIFVLTGPYFIHLELTQSVF
jgi:hypothetical protein